MNNKTRTSDGESEKNDLRNVQRQGRKHGSLVPFHGPDIDASDFFPRTERSEACKRGEPNDGVDFEPGERGPLLANDRPDDESEAVEEVGESGEREESIDESATMRASSDDDGGDGRRGLH